MKGVIFLAQKALIWLKTALILALNLFLIALALFSARTDNSSAVIIESTPVVSQYGSKGTEVTKIQQRLKNWGYFDGPVTGNYGTLTTEAVKKFQRAHGLSVTGIADAATLEKIGLPAGTGSSGGNYSNSDYQLLARIISAEARGEPYVGQVAVGAVVLNRVEHPSFPNSVSGVVYQPGAFTAITDGQINEAITDSAYRAAKEALNGSDPTGGAIYYYNPSKTSNKWIRSRPVITQIGEHLFCS